MNGVKSRTLKIETLARVEGEGAVLVKLKGNSVTDVQLKIYEPPRFFEGFLRGRHFLEVPDITARICGICPVAYQMSSVHALEQACGITIDGPIRDLRRLLYCGEWIESHALHIFLLHAPDFLGYPDAITMSAKHPDVVKMGLELKKIGNELVRIIGGREIHPINVRVGGFYRVPQKSELVSIAQKLKSAIDLSKETVKWVSALPFPDFDREYEFVALRHPSEYAINEGRLVSNRGLDIPVQQYESHFEEEHVRHSHALHSVRKGHGAYLTGPLARFVLNLDKLSPAAHDAALAAGLNERCRNPFRSIIARGVEMLYACEEAFRIIENYQAPPSPALEVTPQEATGCACTEAPRGTLYHRYKINEQGIILDAKIVPPTAQNQKSIEADLKGVVGETITIPEKQLLEQCEKAVRNHDPCISCATHFLKLEMERE